MRPTFVPYHGAQPCPMAHGNVVPTGRRLLVLAAVAAGLLLVLPGAPASAQGRVKARGFLLQIHDPTPFIEGAPATAKLTGSAGTSRLVTLLDDGVQPDRKANDRLYTAPVPDFSDPRVAVELMVAGEAWKVEVKIPTYQSKPRVFLTMNAGGKFREESADAAPRMHEGKAPPPEPTEQPPPDLPSASRDGKKPPLPDSPEAHRQPAKHTRFPSWFIYSLAVGLLFTTARVIYGGRIRGGAAARGAARGEPLLPVRLRSGDVMTAVKAPLLSGVDLATLGLPRGSAPVGDPLEGRWSPEALMAELQRRADQGDARPGLLILDSSLLDDGREKCPMRELAGLVGGRYPLWIVDGPADWPLWPESFEEIS